jgi:hypothetical protein
VSDETLAERARRVELAQEALTDDVTRLSRAGEELGRRTLQRTSVFAFVGGAVVLGALTLRAVKRRWQRPRPGLLWPPRRRSLLNEAARALLLVLVRQLSLRAVSRILPVVPPPPQLPSAPEEVHD